MNGRLDLHDPPISEQVWSDAVLTRYYQELLDFCLCRARGRDMTANLAQEACLRVLSVQQALQGESSIPSSPKAYVDGSLARFHVSTASVLKRVVGERP